MKPTVRIDSSGMRDKIEAMLAKSSRAGRVAVAVLGAQATREMALKAEALAKDTGRYKRGWAMAHNDAASRSEGEVSPMGLPLVTPSKRASEIRKRFAVQYEKWVGVETKYRRWKAEYERRPGHEKWPSYRRLLKTLDKVGDIVDRLIQDAESLDRTPDDDLASAIVIGGKQTVRPGLSNLLRVHTKLYGGSAVLFERGGQPFINGKNLEPHARIVEKRLKIMADGLLFVKQRGGKRASDAYLKRVTQGVDVQGS